MTESREDKIRKAILMTPEGKGFEPLMGRNAEENPDSVPISVPLADNPPHPDVFKPLIGRNTGEIPDSGPISVPLAVNPPHFESEMP